MFRHVQRHLSHGLHSWHMPHLRKRAGPHSGPTACSQSEWMEEVGMPAPSATAFSAASLTVGPRGTFPDEGPKSNCKTCRRPGELATGTGAHLILSQPLRQEAMADAMTIMSHLGPVLCAVHAIQNLAQ